MQLLMTAGTKLVTAAKGLTFAKAASIAGTAVGAAAPIVAGQQQAAIARNEAAQLEARAKSEAATASRRAAEETRRTRIIASRAQAVGASSGGGRDLVLESAIEEEGTYRQMVALWEGEEVAAGLEAQADASRLSGRFSRRAGVLKGAAAGATGYASLREKYGD